MRKHWLGGVALGVSAALLLAGGAALAQGSVEVDQTCFECWPGPGAPTEDYVVRFTFSGWPTTIAYRLINNGIEWTSGEVDPAEAIPILSVGCDGWWKLFPPLEVAPAGVPLQYGDVDFEFSAPDAGGSRVVKVPFVFAEDCTAQAFVPEPGAIMLLVSGSAGLASYSMLRWRRAR